MLRQDHLSQIEGIIPQNTTYTFETEGFRKKRLTHVCTKIAVSTDKKQHASQVCQRHEKKETSEMLPSG